MKKLLPIIIMLLITSCVHKKTPVKFDNPIFNSVLESDNKFESMYKIYPTYINDLTVNSDDRCEFLDQDEHAVFMVTKKTIHGTQYDRYHLFVSNFKYPRNYYKETRCEVDYCTFEVVEGRFEYHANNLPYRAKSEACKDYPEFNWQSKIRTNCLQELIDRGWDKYIPVEIPQYMKDKYLK